jgi:hypothetical protein
MSSPTDKPDLPQPSPPHAPTVHLEQVGKVVGITRLILRKLAWVATGGLGGAALAYFSGLPVIDGAYLALLGTLFVGALGGGKVGPVGWSLLCGALLGAFIGLFFRPFKSFGTSGVQLSWAWIGSGVGLVWGVMLEFWNSKRKPTSC